MSPFRVGVLGLQGDFAEHLALLSELGPNILPSDVRTIEALQKVDALILPGGESSALRAVLSDGKRTGDAKDGKSLLRAIQEFSKTKPVWGICAGMILLADTIEGGEAPLVGGLGISVTRNAFGRQCNSSLKKMDLQGSAKDFGCLAVSHFIRAPVAVVTQPNVEVLATTDKHVVAARKSHLLGTSFHPELTHDKTWCLYFLQQVCKVQLPLDSSALPAVGPNMLFPAQGISYHGNGLEDKVLSADEVTAVVAKGMTHQKRKVDELLCRTHPSIRRISGIAAHLLPKEVSATQSLNSSLSAKYAMPRFLCGGVIMDVVTPAQARVAEEAGACSVMALERIPADIKADGGVARSSDPRMIKEIMATVKNLPVMAKARIGHIGEAKILEALDVDCIDESEVLTAADEKYHINKHDFKMPFVCGAKDLGEALRRISEGAAMIRLKGDAGTGNVVHAVRHARQVFGDIRQLQALSEDQLFNYCKEHSLTDIGLVKLTRDLGRLPVTTFAAGGIATPADVALLMALGCDGVFVGSGIFKGENSAQRARAMVKACTWWEDPELVAEVSEGLGKGMVGILDKGERYAFAEDDKL